VAAVILEPVQGHGGWIDPPPEFLPKIREICNDHGILLISDEVITGFGRTGKWFGIQNYDVVPDIIACGKGLASGFPISAMITTPEISSVWKSLQHTSTFMGHPAGCAAAMASLAEIEERNLVDRSAQLGARFKERLLEMKERHAIVGDVRGIGSMMGIEIVRDKATKEPGSEEGARIVHRALEKGVMITNYGGTYHNVIKMSPPLVITDEQFEVALDLLDESIEDVAATV
jgi:4-aminobutyrate aminotransferase